MNIKLSKVERIATIEDWLSNHPAGTAAQAKKDLGMLGVGKSTYNEDFNTAKRKLSTRVKKRSSNSNHSSKHPGGRPKGNRTVRMTLTMTPDVQKRLRTLCTNVSDWFETMVNEQFKQHNLDD